MCVMYEEGMPINGSQCINVTVTPVENPTQGIPTVEVKTDDFLNQFSNEPLTEDPEQVEGKKKLKSLISYLKSDRFKKKVNSEAYKTGIPPRQIAKGFIAKAFGVIGDILGIAIDAVNYTLNSLVDMLSNILHSGINLISRIANGIYRIFTFNQTCIF